MKWLFHPVSTTFGIATLCLLAILGPLISPSHTVIYHTSGPVLTLFVAVLFNLFTLWALITIVLLFAEKPGRRQVLLWSALVLALPWILLKNASMLAGFMLPHWVSVSIFALLLAIFVTLSVCWKPSFLPKFQRVQRALTIVFGFVALNGILIVAQLLWFAWQARALNSPVALHQRQAESIHHAAHARVIWILLDELSYQQVYERRFPGLNLPTFDAIAQKSTVFTHVVPEGAYTEEVVPSLITGLPVDSIRVSSDGRRLSLQDPATEKWKTFNPHETVFQDALNEGYSTAVAGWYNPYCRILAKVLDRCFWTFQLPYPGDIVPGQPLIKNILQPVVHRLDATASFLSMRSTVLPKSALEADLHIKDYREVRSAGDAMLADGSANFLFLHIPVPHPWGIYNRRNEILTSDGGSYIDNLALADRYLAHVRDLLQRRGEWDSSTVVIMGDHSWRTSFIWSKSGDWTPEDETASHGAEFDDRPAYIVKLPQQQQSLRIDVPFKAIHTRSLLDALLAGQIHTGEDLNIWVRKQK